jgi:DNA-binding transcriptional MerR regulator/methylmalonyl-CoA mutase cobalamin-binding subunit
LDVLDIYCTGILYGDLDMASEGARDKPRHPIQVVARRTGLTPDVLRAWERCYGLVHPERASSGRRLYSDADVRRLALLRRATQTGRTIGQLADLSDDQIRRLIDDDLAATAPRSVTSAPIARPDPRQLRREALEAVQCLDGGGLRHVLTCAALALSPPELVDHILVPLMRTIGALWRRGDLGIAHQHMASAIVRTTLAELAQPRDLADAAPTLVTATPARQLHELGALVVAATAAADRWRVAYLGTDVPGRDIAAAATQADARAVALSITYPLDDSLLAREIAALRADLAPSVPILVGGLGAAAYVEALTSVGAMILGDLQNLRAILGSIRFEHDGAAA